MNLAELGRRWGQIRPDRLAVRCDGIDRTWGQLEDRSNALARGLQRRGVTSGDRVGLLLMNCVELPELVLATLKLGAICVPLNVVLTAVELTPIVLDAGCSVIVTEPSLLDRLNSAVAVQPQLQIFSVGGGDVAAFDSLLDDGSRPVPIADVDEAAPAFLCYTSGTTGVQKGAVLTHGGMRAGATTKILSEGLNRDERILVPVQFVYTGAVISVFMELVYYLGAAMILEPSFDADRCLDIIENERITLMSGVPVVYERMAQSPSFTGRDISSLRSLSAGGAPVSRDLLETFQARGIPMVQGYGLTETSGYATTLDFANAYDHLGSAGLPVFGSRIEIRDGTAVCDAGAVGEVVVRGPHVMAGYWNNPQLTAETLVDGWLHTGDLGYLDDEGFLTLVDRKKDMLISGGHNVYPAEIEQTLAGLVGVEELAVIAVPDAQWGQVPLVVVRSARPAADVALDVRAACTASLAGYKRPKYVVSALAPLPRTFAGKIAKPVLRTQYPGAPADASIV